MHHTTPRRPAPPPDLTATLDRARTATRAALTAVLAQPRRLTGRDRRAVRELEGFAAMLAEKAG